MNRLTKEARAQVLHLLCEGMSIRAVTRLTGASKTTVTKLLVDAGQAAAWYQDRVFQNLESRRIQVDEIWGFVGAKAKNAKPEKKATGEAGDVWLWVATDADTKLVPSFAGRRSRQPVGDGLHGRSGKPSCEPRPTDERRPLSVLGSRRRRVWWRYRLRHDRQALRRGTRKHEGPLQPRRVHRSPQGTDRRQPRLARTSARPTASATTSISECISGE